MIYLNFKVNTIIDYLQHCRVVFSIYVVAPKGVTKLNII